MALQTETEALIARYIEPDAGFSTPDRAWIADANYSVKTIVRWLRQTDWDIEETARRCDLPVEAVRAAVAFYERYRDVIDARILLDDAYFLDWETIDKEQAGPGDAWMWRHIDFLDGMRTPHEARMEASGTRVKTIIRQLQLDDWDVERVAKSYHLPAEAVHAAIAYFERHKDLFNAKIILDNAPDLDWEQT